MAAKYGYVVFVMRLRYGHIRSNSQINLAGSSLCTAAYNRAQLIPIGAYIWNRDIHSSLLQIVIVALFIEEIMRLNKTIQM